MSAQFVWAHWFQLQIIWNVSIFAPHHWSPPSCWQTFSALEPANQFKLDSLNNITILLRVRASQSLEKSINWQLFWAGGCQVIYVLLPLSPLALSVQQCVQGNCVGIQGNGRWPLIGQMGCQLLSGPQIIVFQHCPKTKDSVQCSETIYWQYKVLFSVLGRESFDAVKKCSHYTII